MQLTGQACAIPRVPAVTACSAHASGVGDLCHWWKRSISNLNEPGVTARLSSSFQSIDLQYDGVVVTGPTVRLQNGSVKPRYSAPRLFGGNTRICCPW